MIIREQDIPRSAYSCKFMREEAQELHFYVSGWSKGVNYVGTADDPHK